MVFSTVAISLLASFSAKLMWLLISEILFWVSACILEIFFSIYDSKNYYKNTFLSNSLLLFLDKMLSPLNLSFLIAASNWLWNSWLCNSNSDNYVIMLNTFNSRCPLIAALLKWFSERFIESVELIDQDLLDCVTWAKLIDFVALLRILYCILLKIQVWS